MTGIVLDLSNYDFDHDVTDPQWAVKLKSLGVVAAIVGCQREEKAKLQVQALLAADIKVIGVYAFLYFGFSDGVRGEVDKALRIAREFDIKRVWLDVEATPPNETVGMTSATRIVFVTDAVKQVEDAGFSAGVYTGGWYWPFQMANTKLFSRLPLWHSAYPTDGHAIRTAEYGGWTKVAIHQYTSELMLLGRTRDANYVFEVPVEPEKEGAMTDDDLLVLFAGSEEHDDQGTLHPREVRLRNAKARYAAILAGEAPSVAEVAASATARVGAAEKAIAELQAAGGIDDSGLFGRPLKATITIEQPGG